MAENENIELFGDDLSDVLGVVPPRMVRWGMTVIFAAVLGVVIFSLVFVYPDVIIAPVTIVSQKYGGRIEITGFIKLPVNGSGKVKTGQRVNIKVENFPYIEYGTLRGMVKKIDSIPKSDNNGRYYNTIIQFPLGLLTNYNLKLEGFQTMYGTAEIIMNNRSLFNRFIKPLNLSQTR